MRLRNLFRTAEQIERMRKAARETALAAAVEKTNVGKFRKRRRIAEEAANRTPAEHVEAQLMSNRERRRQTPAI